MVGQALTEPTKPANLSNQLRPAAVQTLACFLSKLLKIEDGPLQKVDRPALLGYSDNQKVI